MSAVSREAILEAAAGELADRGFDGVRLEHVAKRAGFNKALIYRYFGDRVSLLKAALQRKFVRREALLDRLPPTFGEMLQWWTNQQQADPEFMRLILREALQDDGSEPIEGAQRRAYYARQIEQLRALQAHGVVDAEFDAEMLFFALLVITVGPAMLPQIARLSTGEAPGTEGFDARWDAFLGRLAEHLKR